jgi:hypothetical protein
MKMSFNAEEGKRVTLKGIMRDVHRIVSAKKMHVIFRCEEVAYAS